ncbi:TPA: hypothetical protein VJT00_001852, partial [Streptococcus pyogenes]|nr:hypothetical protein [Streptococcus pyogenes]
MKRKRIWRSTAAGLTASMLAGMLILASSAQSALAADSSALPAGSVTSSLPVQKDALAVTKEFRLITLGDSITVGYEPNLKELPYGYVERLQEQGLLHGRT